MNTSVGGRAVAPERDPRSWVGSPLELVESKLHPPPARPGIVNRTALVERLLASDGVPVVCVVAPVGYGKTTLLAQWAQHTARRVGWVSLDERDNDPATLLTYLAVALDRVEPIDPRVVRGPAGPGASTVGAVPRLAAAMAAMTQPVALVLDHAELLTSQQALDVVAGLAAQLPTGAQLLLASRARPPLPVALLARPGPGAGARGRGARHGPPGGRRPAGGRRRRARRRRGRRAARADRGVAGGAAPGRAGPQKGGSGRHPWAGFAGDDRFLVDYLWSELLDRLPPERVAFLTRTAVLERMCGPLCDAILETTGSNEVLGSLEEDKLLLVPLDRRRHWYRYHHLFQELLRTELDRREPELVPALHARAASWCADNGLPETAIDHAQAAGDPDRAAQLVWRLAMPAYGAGRVETTRRWFGWFEDQGLLGRYPSVTMLGAWLQALVGQPAAAERWTEVAEQGPVAGTLPDGSTSQSYLALLRALLCRNGVETMLADTQAALDELSPGSQWRPTAQLLEGICHLLAGQADRADPILAHAAEVAIEAGALPAAAVALAERSLVAMHHQDWHQAGTLAEQAQGVVQAGELDGYVASALVHVATARVAVHQGDLPGVHQQLARATRLRPLLTYALPYLAVQTLLELGRASLALDDAAGARVVLRQARDVLQRRPDLGILPAQVDELWSKLDRTRGGTVGFASLTTAELRLLPLLPTHLTFREIGQRLFVSQHTVKTQAMSIYRKLGVSSRSQAVQRAQQLGLGG